MKPVSIAELAVGDYITVLGWYTFVLRDVNDVQSNDYTGNNTHVGVAFQVLHIESPFVVVSAEYGSVTKYTLDARRVAFGRLSKEFVNLTR